VLLCLWHGRYGSHNNTKGNLKYIILPFLLELLHTHWDMPLLHFGLALA